MELLDEFTPSKEVSICIGYTKLACVLPQKGEKLFMEHDGKLMQFKVLSVYVKILRGYDIVYKVRTSNGIKYIKGTGYLNYNKSLISDIRFFRSVVDYKNKQFMQFSSLDRRQLFADAVGNDIDRCFFKETSSEVYMLSGYKWDGTKPTLVSLTKLPVWLEIDLDGLDDVLFVNGMTCNIPNDIYPTKEDCERNNEIKVDLLPDDEEEQQEEESNIIDEQLKERIKDNIKESIKIINELGDGRNIKEIFMAIFDEI